MRAGQRLRIEVLRPGEEKSLRVLLRIYESSLPASARKSESALREMLANPAYLFLLARIDAEVVGFSIVARFAADAALLEYMAVDACHRGAGIGSRLLQESATSMGIGSGCLLVEVESAQPDAEHALHQRRIDFYRRSGCREVSGLAWRMPPVSAEEPPPMNLYVFAGKLPPVLAKSRLRAWLESIYAEVYGRPRQDPAIDAMLFSLPGEIQLL